MIYEVFCYILFYKSHKIMYPPRIDIDVYFSDPQIINIAHKHIQVVIFDSYCGGNEGSSIT